MGISISAQLARIDAEIMELRSLLEYQLQKEASEGKRTLLVSKGIRYRIKNLETKRGALQRRYRSAPSMQMTYAVELANRENALRVEEEELARVKQSLDDLLLRQTIQSLNEDVNLTSEIRAISKDIEGQRTRVRNKERALVNWIAKEDLITKAACKEQEREFVFTAQGIKDTVKQLEHECLSDSNISLEEKLNTSSISRDPRWNGAVVNNANINLLSQFEIKDSGETISFELSINEEVERQNAEARKIAPRVVLPDFEKPKKKVLIEDNTPPLTDEEIDKLNELKPEDWE